MEEKRRFYRMPGKIKASYLSTSSDWNGLFCTNISRQGMCIGIPYQENLKAGTELMLKCPIPTVTEPVLITGTIMWTKELDAYKDYPIICGLQFKEMNPEHKWELLHYSYDTWHEKLKKGIQDDAATVEAPRLREELSNIDAIFNVLVSRYAEVVNVKKAADIITIIVNQVKWDAWDRNQKHSNANRMHEVISAIDNNAKIFIRDTEGKKLAWMMHHDEGKNYMVVAGGSFSKTDN
jgi:hypothetical protein